MTERASMRDGRADLELGPRLLYPAKACATRARSLAWLARRRPAPPGARILFYHRVSDARDELAVAPRAFAAQMEWLARTGRRGVDLDELTRLLAGGGSLDGVVGLSFDDAYLDVAEHAAPVLERLGFAATVFVATGVTDGRARFTWYREQPPLIGWAAMRDLDGAGALRFEAHTLTHPNLLALDEDAARAEIAGSKEELEERLGRPVTGFCYPAGLHGERERRLVAEAGFAFAATCEPGANRPGGDPLTLRRIQVDARDGLVDVRAKATGGHDAPPPLRGLYRRLRYGASSRS